MQRIAIIDYGMGNCRSVANALRALAPDADIAITHDAQYIGSADRIVFPGQGAASACMARLHDTDLVQAITEAVQSRPFLGICVGMQVLLDHSEENGGVACLGMIPGQTKKFATTDEQHPHTKLKLPQLGWNHVRQDIDHPLWHRVSQDALFYFCNSYYAEPTQALARVGSADYGGQFCCALAQQNIFGCQFHPEKSATDGLQLLRNFIQWRGH